MSRNPHDALFKYAFSQTEHAIGELRTILPPAVVEQIDFTTLSACPGSFVDEALADCHADLLFSARSRDAERSSTCYSNIRAPSTG